MRETEGDRDTDRELRCRERPSDEKREQMNQERDCMTLWRGQRIRSERQRRGPKMIRVRTNSIFTSFFRLLSVQPGPDTIDRILFRILLSFNLNKN